MRLPDLREARMTRAIRCAVSYDLANALTGGRVFGGFATLDVPADTAAPDLKAAAVKVLAGLIQADAEAVPVGVTILKFEGVV